MNEYFLCKVAKNLKSQKGYIEKSIHILKETAVIGNFVAIPPTNSFFEIREVGKEFFSEEHVKTLYA